MALYDYYKAKSAAIKEKERKTQEGTREKSRSPSPVVIEIIPEDEEPQPQKPVRRYRLDNITLFVLFHDARHSWNIRRKIGIFSKYKRDELLTLKRLVKFVTN